MLLNVQAAAASAEQLRTSRYYLPKCTNVLAALKSYATWRESMLMYLVNTTKDHISAITPSIYCLIACQTDSLFFTIGLRVMNPDFHFNETTTA